MHSICPAGQEGIYSISNLPLGKYIDFAPGQKYRIAKQYIEKKTTRKKFFRVVLSYYYILKIIPAKAPIPKNKAGCFLYLLEATNNTINNIKAL